MSTLDHVIDHMLRSCYVAGSCPEETHVVYLCRQVIPGPQDDSYKFYPRVISSKQTCEPITPDGK